MSEQDNIYYEVAGNGQISKEPKAAVDGVPSTEIQTNDPPRAKVADKVLFGIAVVFCVVALVLGVLTASLGVEVLTSLFALDQQAPGADVSESLGMGLTAGFGMVFFLVFGAVEMIFTAIGSVLLFVKPMFSKGKGIRIASLVTFLVTLGLFLVNLAMFVIMILR